ncbi:hypothetical protein [Cerasicoccus arenae]|uniref:N-acetyltransferase domain-containing protein n=1 Tax=Cerasicoccus arenae TaxID=424488 RepID=A0A8J3DKK5_9BACT|nr:hypothetical protein [Cerasicoccus arenae]MBK1856656.1 hypothetical protein [Cerasicoccus arenae]GHC12198.1 hypothetical protein GCM10007047_31900 [Cerasicoccus arenae]
MGDHRILIKAVDPHWLELLTHAAWSGVYVGDAVHCGWVAVTPGRHVILGCVVWLYPATGEPPFLVFSVSRSARQGEAVAMELAQQVESGDFRQRNWTPADSPECHALESIGFQVCDSGYFYDIPMEKVCERLERVGKALDRLRPLEPGQQVTSWQPERRAEVRRIALAESLADTAYLDSIMTPGPPMELHPHGTTLAFENGKLVGFFLAVYHGTHGEIPVRWVAPSHRNSWVNARLMIHSLQEGYQRHQEVRHIRFKGDEAAHLETRYMCQQFGGAEIAQCVRMARSMSA